MQPTFTNRRDVRPPDIRQHFPIRDDANANLVGTALESNSDYHG